MSEMTSKYIAPQRNSECQSVLTAKCCKTRFPEVSPMDVTERKRVLSSFFFTVILVGHD